MRHVFILVFSFSSTLVFSQRQPWQAPHEADTLKSSLPRTEETLASGKQLYTSLCAVCHGPKGKGDGIGSTALLPKPANFLKPAFTGQPDGVLFWKISTGRPPMPSFKEVLAGEDIWAIIEYIRTLTKNSKK